jgi:hypothetical protein
MAVNDGCEYGARPVRSSQAQIRDRVKRTESYRQTGAVPACRVHRTRLVGRRAWIRRCAALPLGAARRARARTQHGAAFNHKPGSKGASYFMYFPGIEVLSIFSELIKLLILYHVYRFRTSTGKKTPGGAGTHTRHTGHSTGIPS